MQQDSLLVLTFKLNSTKGSGQQDGTFHEPVTKTPFFITFLILIVRCASEIDRVTAALGAAHAEHGPLVAEVASRAGALEVVVLPQVLLAVRSVVEEVDVAAFLGNSHHFLGHFLFQLFFSSLPTTWALL